jgi:hypothetical protein
METNVMTGAYTKFTTELNDQEKKVFEQAMHDLVGVKYTPLAVATQVVEGVNYKYFCNAVGVYPGAMVHGALVNIYQAPNGIPTVTGIKMCE